MTYPKPQLSFSDLYKWVNKSSYKIDLPKHYKQINWGYSGAERLADICAEIALKKKRDINICLPAYFCGQSLRFLRSTPVKFYFYELDNNFLPNYSKIINFDENTPLDVFIHVHYFGNIAGQEESREFSDKFGAYLIEDCAHVISPYVNTKWTGDFLVFSPHKHFPLPSVGLSISRKKFFKKKKKNSEIFPINWLVKELLKKLRFFKFPPNWGQTWSDQLQELDPIKCNDTKKSVTYSYLSSYTLSASKRANNAVYLVNQLSVINGWRAVQNIDRIKFPYLLGMICDTPDLAKQRFDLLNNDTQLVMQWPDLPLEIKDYSELESQSIDLLGRVLFFFIHQKINIDELSDKIDRIISKPNF